jgi:hypothetical protein
MSFPRTVTIAASTRHAFLSLVLVLVAAGSGSSAHADWLVLSSGESVETKGAWTLQGPKVIFTTTRGVLSSVRASEVNVDASRALTVKKQEDASRVAAAPAAAPKPAPVLVLTDKDFAKKPAAAADGAAAVAGAASDGAAAGGAAAAHSPEMVVPTADSLETRVAHQMPGPPSLRVTHWSARPTGEDQISIFGEVQNVGARVTAGVDVGVTLIDSEGRRIGSTEAVISSTALMPQAQADFEAKFDASANFAMVQFALKTVEIEVGKPEGGEDLEEPVGEEPAASGKAPATGQAPATKPASQPAATGARPGSPPPVGDAPHATAKAQPKPQSG